MEIFYYFSCLSNHLTSSLCLLWDCLIYCCWTFLLTLQTSFTYPSWRFPTRSPGPSKQYSLPVTHAAALTSQCLSTSRVRCYSCWIQFHMHTASALYAPPKPTQTGQRRVEPFTPTQGQQSTRWRIYYGAVYLVTFNVSLFFFVRPLFSRDQAIYVHFPLHTKSVLRRRLIPDLKLPKSNRKLHLYFEQQLHNTLSLSGIDLLMPNQPNWFALTFSIVFSSGPVPDSFSPYQ